jgi:hypothetical protein
MALTLRRCGTCRPNDYVHCDRCDNCSSAVLDECLWCGHTPLSAGASSAPRAQPPAASSSRRLVPMSSVQLHVLSATNTAAGEADPPKKRQRTAVERTEVEVSDTDDNDVPSWPAAPVRIAETDGVLRAVDRAQLGSRRSPAGRDRIENAAFQAHLLMLQIMAREALASRLPAPPSPRMSFLMSMQGGRRHRQRPCGLTDVRAACIRATGCCNALQVFRRTARRRRTTVRRSVPRAQPCDAQPAESLHTVDRQLHSIKSGRRTPLLERHEAGALSQRAGRAH